MHYKDAYEIASELRRLLRRSDRFGYDLQRLKEEILSMAEVKETYGEYEEMKVIVQMQRDLVESS